MKYETYENIASIIYGIFLLAILVLAIFSLFIDEDGIFVQLLFLFGFITFPVALIVGGAATLVIVLSLIKFKYISFSYRFVTITTLLYILGCTYVPYLPWGGESFSSAYGPILTGVSIIYACFGIWMIFAQKYQHHTWPK